jgi:hypothetical protein
MQRDSFYRYKGFLICLLVFWSFTVSVAQTARFEAYADARQVVRNGYFNVSFTLTNADGGNFQAPSFRDFVVAGGPNRSMSTTLINGVMSREISYSYTLRPRKTGRFTIESAVIEANGKELRTPPLVIEVVEGNTAEEENKQVFVRAELSTTEAWMGQQIILDYKLYTTVDIKSYNIIEESDYQGFYAEDIRRFDGRVMREVIEGTQYITKVIKRTVLFPQQTGTLQIDPMIIQMGMAVEVPGRRSRFLFNEQIQQIDLSTEMRTIEVKTLPQPAPENFTGAVGKFDFQVSSSHTDASTDDAISVQIAVGGNGDIKRVGAPDLGLSEAFEVYDPKVIGENSVESNGYLISEKVFEYFLLPREAGTYALQPSFTYFDVDKADYVTLVRDPLEFDIKPGSARPEVNRNNLSPDAGSMADIHFITLDTRLLPKNHYFTGSTLFWALFVLPFFGIAGTFIHTRTRQRLMQEDPQLRKSKRAQKVALERLEKARLLLEQQNSKGFYDELSKALLGYIGDRLSIPLSELSKDNIREKIAALTLESVLVDQVVSTIQTCEFALFAGKDQTADMQAIYDHTLRIIINIEAYAVKK